MVELGRQTVIFEPSLLRDDDDVYRVLSLSPLG